MSFPGQLKSSSISILKDPADCHLNEGARDNQFESKYCTLLIQIDTK